MQAENLVLNNCCEWKIIKELGEAFPDVGSAILTKAFIVEPINLSDLSGLMVASEDGYAIRVAYFESNQKSDGFNTIVSSVNIVSHKKIVGVRHFTSQSEELL